MGKIKISSNHDNDDEDHHQRPSSPTIRSQSTLHAQTVLDKPLAESQTDDIQRLTTPLICHDGDSVQQTFVCSQPGNYVLQWKHSSNHHNNSPFDFISSSHKTKIMYIYKRMAPARVSSDLTGNGHIVAEQRTSMSSS